MTERPKRWWYRAPSFDIKDLLIPCVKFFRCGDEFCNDTLFIRLPALGHITIRTGRTIRINDRCQECVNEYGPWCQGCQGCHNGPRCHNWIACEHEVSEVAYCPGCGGDYCTTCEQDPKESCPYLEGKNGKR